MHLKRETDVSPTRQIARDGFTQFTPNETARRQMLSIAEKEARNHEAFKQDNRPYCNFSGAVGGTLPQPNHLPSMSQKAPAKTPQEKARMYREEAKQREMKECEEMKRKQREKTDRNAERERQKEQNQRRNHREVNRAFLDDLEKKTSQSSKKSSSSGSFATNPKSSTTETTSDSPPSVTRTPGLPTGFDGFLGTGRLAQ